MPKNIKKIVEIAAAPPQAAEGQIYVKTADHLPYFKESGAGVEHPMLAAPGLTVALFQENAATGTFNATPNNVNDNNTNTQFGANAEAQYAEVDFSKNVTIYQYRLYGDDLNNNDGAWKIEYYDGSWHDWVTGIVTNEAVWTGWVAVSAKVCSKIRLTCTTVDSFGSSLGNELEIKWSCS